MADLIIAITDLVESEGAALRRAAARLGMGLALIVLATGLVAVGTGLCLWAAYQYLGEVVGVSLASLLVGLAALVVSGLFLWAARRLTR